MADIQKAVWSQAYQDKLPDSSFAYIEPGGKKDSEGKTVPRSLRHFPIRDANGKPDADHVRNALARLDQSQFGDKARGKVEAAARELGIDVHENEPKVQKSLDIEFDFPITIQKQYVQKSDDGVENWYIEGYAATSDFDLQGDIITPDALKKSETQLLENSTVLYNHHDDQPIGRVVDSKLDSNGLLLKILISKSEPDIWQKVKEGVLNKFSISAKVLKAVKKFDKNLGTIANFIEEMFLLEVSLVSVPANPQAKAIGWYVGKALKDYVKKGGVIEMAENLETKNHEDEAALDAEVSKTLAGASAEDDIVTDENGNVIEKAAGVRTADNSLEVSGSGAAPATEAKGDESDSSDGKPVSSTQDSLAASGHGAANGGTAPNAQANAGVAPAAGMNNSAQPTPAAGAGNNTNPAAPAPGFKKGLGWLLLTLEDMDDYLESPDCVGVPTEVREAIKAAIRALSPAAAELDAVEDAQQAELLMASAKEAGVETTEKTAKVEKLEKSVASLVKSNEALVATVRSLQKQMPVTRKGFIRNEEPNRTAADEMREEVKKSANPEDALKTVLTFMHQQEQ